MTRYNLPTLHYTGYQPYPDDYVLYHGSNVKIPSPNIIIGNKCFQQLIRKVYNWYIFHELYVLFKLI